ncbi:Hypothetical predicted protein [Pelobates cultripes]|uniref:Uncharacterized protein n=1 Tax=Pelobates cultripes TaxID=61616 RepID=A0AAD1WL19_PELCU|nr:Hypothetical predicted protein [Pelobates cultripes]
MAERINYGFIGSYRTKAPNNGSRSLNSQVDKRFAINGIKLKTHCVSELRQSGRKDNVVALPSLSHKSDSIQTVRSDLGPKPIVPPNDPSEKSILTLASDFKSILSASRVGTDKGHEEHKLAVQASRGEKDSTMKGQQNSTKEINVLVAEPKMDNAEFERVRREQKELVEKQRRQLMERTSQVKKEVGHLRLQFQPNRLKYVNSTEKTKQREDDLLLARAHLYELKEKQLGGLRIIGSPIKYASVVTKKPAVLHLVARPKRDLEAISKEVAK